MPEILEFTEINEIWQKSLEVGMQRQRNRVLGALPDSVASKLDNAPNDSEQLHSDLQQLNRFPKLKGNRIALEDWLIMASYLVADFPKYQRYFLEKAEKVASLSIDNSRELSEEFSEARDIQEREILRNDLLPIQFVNRASIVGRSVCRVVVNGYKNGKTFNNFNGSPMQEYGTGWLIGSSHVITNYHVINCREDLEPDASDDDFDEQALNAVSQFNYDSENSSIEAVKVNELSAKNKKLDYVVLKLERESKRDPIPIVHAAVTIPDDEVLPANIIQHPNGTAKQVGLRNNLVAKVGETDIYYFTDTFGGSSGSPVCNDKWQVIGLHKAATRDMGRVRFQGRTTSWVNKGTRMDLIIDDLRQNAALWKEISPMVILEKEV